MFDFFVSKFRIFPGAGGKIILLYHRVENVKSDPHLLCVTPLNFEKQVKWLSENVNVVPLRQLTSLKTGDFKRKLFASITFDDGYSDNLYNAARILRKYNLPSTFFITSGKVGDKTPFYWDKETEIPSRGRPLTIKELKRLSSSNLVEIGSHTIKHPHLSTLNSKEQRLEIMKSKKQLENMIGKKVLSFSYPFGKVSDYNKSTLKLVKEAGYKCACANFPLVVNSKTNFYELPRFIVRNWNLWRFRKEIGSFYAYSAN